MNRISTILVALALAGALLAPATAGAFTPEEQTQVDAMAAQINEQSKTITRLVGERDVARRDLAALRRAKVGQLVKQVSNLKKQLAAAQKPSMRLVNKWIPKFTTDQLWEVIYSSAIYIEGPCAEGDLYEYSTSNYDATGYDSYTVTKTRCPD